MTYFTKTDETAWHVVVAVASILLYIPLPRLLPVNVANSGCSRCGLHCGITVREMRKKNALLD